MVNVNKLKGKIKESQMTTEEIAKKLKINPSTFYRKLSEGGQNFKIKEVKELTELISLTPSEASEIFFN